MNESIRYYDSPLGTILLTADETGLTGLWFVDEKTQSDLQISVLGNAFLDEAARWLDAYFAGEIPPSAPKLHLKGSAFQLLERPSHMEIWQKEPLKILARQKCPPRRWAEPLEKILYLLFFPVTESWEPAAGW